MTQDAVQECGPSRPRSVRGRGRVGHGDDCDGRAGRHATGQRAVHRHGGRHGLRREVRSMSRQHRADQELLVVDHVQARVSPARAVLGLPLAVPTQTRGHRAPDDEVVLRLPRPSPRAYGLDRHRRVHEVPPRRPERTCGLRSTPRTGPRSRTSSRPRRNSTSKCMMCHDGPFCDDCHIAEGHQLDAAHRLLLRLR